MSEIDFSEHPKYTAMASEWEKYRDLYEGSHDVLTSSESYLWPHELEKVKNGGAELRRIRELRSRYLNLIESVVSRILSFLFAEDMVVPDEVKKLYDEAYTDVTGTGVSFESFWQNHFAKHYIIYGLPRVLVDASKQKGETVEQSRALGARPFLELLNPLDVKDWQISTDRARRGRYDLLRYEYDVLEPRTNLESAPVIARYSKVLSALSGKYTISIYKSQNENNKITWTKLEEIEVDTEEIPVVSIEGEESFIKDACELQLSLFNLMSAEACVLNAQAFQKIFVIGVSSDEAKLAFGEYVANFLPDGASVEAIDSGNTAPLENAINSTIDRLFKVAFNQVHTLSSDSKEAPGAESQRESKEDFVKLLKSCISEIENAINKTNELWAKFKGDDKFNAKIELSKKITIQDIDRELAIFQAHKDDIKKVQTAYRELLKKRIADLNLPNQEDIEKEIDAADFSVDQNEGLVGNVRTRLLQQVNGDVGEQTTSQAA